ncbi:MAG: hypothetical protein L0Y71_16440 [Gemmataceae bacterium]|nr:hypothetical protein [Gemmataceae bacterium]
MLGALIAGAVLFAGGYALVRWTMADGQAAVDPAPVAFAPRYFAGWTKPDFVLVISGQTHGYLQPCGCSDPQYGGLARRWEFLQSLKKKDWNVVPVDLGDLYPKTSDTPPRQNLLKYETSLRALDVMGYRAVGIGKQELGAPLMNALAQYSLNNERPRPVAADLADAHPDGPFHAMNARPYEIMDVKGLPKIGVVGMIGKTVQELFKETLKFAPDQAAAALRELKNQKTEFNVVLLQTDDKLATGGVPEVDKTAAWCNEQKQAAVNVVVYSSDDPEPPGRPRDLNGTQLITVGHKGKYVGVLGVWRKKGGYEYKYEMVLMAPEFAPRPANPVAALMEDYAKRVANAKLAAQFLVSDHKNQVILRNEKRLDTKYVGSERCADCHAHAHAIWVDAANNGLKHSNALATLVNATNPGLRHMDGECLQCHTTGFRHTTGFNDPNVKDRVKNQLHHVGCESCHGPASAHVNNPKDMDIRKLMNPWAKQFNRGVPEHVRLQRIDNFCQNCHDIDNDVHWDFKKKWPKVIHMNP